MGVRRTQGLLGLLALGASTGAVAWLETAHASARVPSDVRPNTVAPPPVNRVAPRTSTGQKATPKPAPPPVTRTAVEQMRRSVALGTPVAESQEGPPAPELQSLERAEKLLFGQPGVASSLAGPWEGVTEGASGPFVSSTGLPLGRVGSPRDHTGAAGLDWLQHLALPDVPVRFESHTVKYLRFYRESAVGRDVARRWTQKSGRFTDAIRAQLARAGLPRDLVWLSFVESSHEPSIRSPAGAAGLWQFIAETARLYGLTVDRWVDERLSPARSTAAAIAFLSDLKQRFGTWELAMAAYNMGHHGLSRAIRKYNTNDFWQLAELEGALPLETTLYVPKITALAVVMHNRAIFGTEGVSPDPAERFDRVILPAGASLERLQAETGVSLASLRTLNPQYLSTTLPPQQGPEGGGWPLLVPAEVAQQLAASSVARATPRASTRVRLGDTPETIARRLGLDPALLRATNGLGRSERLQAGSWLLIPDGSTQPTWPADTEEMVVLPHAVAPSAVRAAYYRVVEGDDLPTLAVALGVSVSELALWNGLDPEARLQDGMTLRAFSPPEDGSIRLVAEEHAGRRLLAGSPAFLNHHETENGRFRYIVTANSNETLRGIGRRFGLSAGTMERINHRPSREKLSAGTPVVVYTREAIRITDSNVRLALVQEQSADWTEADQATTNKAD